MTSIGRRFELLGFLALGLSIVFFQATRSTPLLDWSYVAEIAHRVRLGFHFYRDLDVVLPPGTFLIQRQLLRLPLDFSTAQLLYSGVQAGLTWFMCTRVAWRLCSHRGVYWALIALLVGYGIAYPYPFYDYDVAFASALFLFVLNGNLRHRDLLLGLLSWGPLAFKQSAGVGFAFAAHVLLIIQTCAQSEAGPPGPRLRHLALGSLLGLVGLIGLFGLASDWVDPRTIFSWTWTQPARLRGSMIANLIRDFGGRKFLFWATFSFVLAQTPWRWARWTAYLPLFAPILLRGHFDEPVVLTSRLGQLWSVVLTIGTLGYAFNPRHVRTTLASAAFITFGVTAAVVLANAASQGLSGSTYAFPPLLAVLFACIASRDPLPGRRIWVASFALGIATIALVNQIGNGRIVGNIKSEGDLARARTSDVRRLSAAGPFLPRFERLVEYVREEISPKDLIHVIPGEDPFYLATGRRPPLPVFQMIQVVFPYEPADIDRMLRSAGVSWIIAKTEVQALDKMTFYKVGELMALIRTRYQLHHALPGYEIYRLAP